MHPAALVKHLPRRSSARFGHVAFAACLLVCFPAATSFGQTLPRERSDWWTDPAVGERLQLTPPQVAAIEAAFRRTLPERKRLRSRLDHLEARLASLMEQGTDERQVLATIDDVERARAAGNIARSLMLLEMYGILTADQRAVLRKLPQRSQ
jgi:Spy/CpxP family protein refolding chaperone